MPGTVLVAVQWAAPANEATVAPDGGLDWSRARSSIGEYDQVAIEVGRTLADGLGAVLVAVGVGGQDAASSLAIKAAASRGVDRVVVVLDEAPSTVGVAAALAAQTGVEQDVRAVVLGDSSVDHATTMVAPVLAGLLGLPVLTDVRQVTPDGDDLQVVHTVSGAREVVAVSGPVVLAVAADAAVPRVPGMRDILAAAKKPSTVVTASDLGVTPAHAARTRSRVRIDPPDRRRHVIREDDPTVAAQRLVTELVEEGVL
ncbi:MAG: electron transfer flavoprotein beta subunit/FixA family protein [Actinobacteria bacterium]|nr:electron transfer flavoprotein beta subunit/FixA family protein [Actinomycetota bacterium]